MAKYTNYGIWHIWLEGEEEKIFLAQLIKGSERDSFLTVLLNITIVRTVMKIAVLMKC